jgi:hypothetical protein
MCVYVCVYVYVCVCARGDEDTGLMQVDYARSEAPYQKLSAVVGQISSLNFSYL